MLALDWRILFSAILTLASWREPIPSPIVGRGFSPPWGKQGWFLMTEFSIAWNRRQWSRQLECLLIQRVIVAGQPALKVDGRLAAILEDQVNEIAARDSFWHAVARKLGRKRKLSPRDIWAIEALIAQRVPKPTPSYPVTTGPSANPIVGPHSQNLQRALRTR